MALAFLSLLPLNDVVSETQLGFGRDSRIEKKENNRWGRDPFYRNRAKGNNENENQNEAEEATTPTADFRLSAIIFREGNSVAIINDQIVRPGDKLGIDIVVSRILPHKVFLRKGKRTIVLKVQAFGHK